MLQVVTALGSAASGPESSTAKHVNLEMRLAIFLAHCSHHINCVCNMISDVAVPKLLGVHNGGL